jgi:HEAT repeat protein
VRAREEAETAVQKIGTNALPTLIAMTKSRDSRLMRWITALSRKQTLFTFDLYTQEEREYMAEDGFEILGDSASPEVDTLKNLLSTPIDDEIRSAVVCELGAIGPKAKAASPALLKILDNNDDLLKAYSLRSINYIGQEPDLVIPMMIRLLKSSNWQPVNRQGMLSMILRNLEAYKEKSQPSVPLIVPLLTDSNSQVRQYATNALMAIAPETFQNISHGNQ